MHNNLVYRYISMNTFIIYHNYDKIHCITLFQVHIRLRNSIKTKNSSLFII